MGKRFAPRDVVLAMARSNLEQALAYRPTTITEREMKVVNVQQIEAFIDAHR